MISLEANAERAKTDVLVGFQNRFKLVKVTLRRTTATANNGANFFDRAQRSSVSTLRLIAVAIYNIGSLHNTWNESVWYDLLVGIPIVAILLLAHMIVSYRSVDKKYQKVDCIVVGYNAAKTADQAP